MVNPYTKENPGNFANDRERASRAGHKGGQTTSERYLSEARQKNQGGGGSRGRGRSRD